MILSITRSPEIIDIPKPVRTAREKPLSQNRPAIEAFTTLFDMTAIKIVEAAITRVGFPVRDSLAIV